MTEIYGELAEEKVYINKTMDERYPLMARAIYQDGSMQMIIMLPGLKLGENDAGSGQLPYRRQLFDSRTPCSVPRDTCRPWKKSATARIPESWTRKTLSPWYRLYKSAEGGISWNVFFLHIEVPAENYRDVDAAMTEASRGSDYMGIMTDGGLYVLLANTTKKSVCSVQEAF